MQDAITNFPSKAWLDEVFPHLLLLSKAFLWFLWSVISLLFCQFCTDEFRSGYTDPARVLQTGHREACLCIMSAFITDLATDIPRFKFTQVISRAVHRIIPCLCPPQWDGSANIAETSLKCPFHPGVSDSGRCSYLSQRGWKEQNATLQCVLLRPLGLIIADGLTQTRICFQILMQWLRMRKVTALLFVFQKSRECEQQKHYGTSFRHLSVGSKSRHQDKKWSVYFPLVLHIAFAAA